MDTGPTGHIQFLEIDIVESQRDNRDTVRERNPQPRSDWNAHSWGKWQRQRETSTKGRRAEILKQNPHPPVEKILRPASRKDGRSQSKYRYLGERAVDSMDTGSAGFRGNRHPRLT